MQCCGGLQFQNVSLATFSNGNLYHHRQFEETGAQCKHYQENVKFPLPYLWYKDCRRSGALEWSHSTIHRKMLNLEEKCHHKWWKGWKYLLPAEKDHIITIAKQSKYKEDICESMQSCTIGVIMHRLRSSNSCVCCWWLFIILNNEATINMPRLFQHARLYANISVRLHLT